ncbi:MAG: hypothetical protein ABJ215_11680 [Alphaproteobacteria bacterium]
MNMPAAYPSRPPTANDLNYMERLVLHALRQWVQNRARWSEVVLEFNRVCGPRTATRLCEALDNLFCDIGIEARRHLRLYPPVGCHVSQDELCILNLLAAHQAGDDSHAEALLRWLVPDTAADRIGLIARKIARILFETGYSLKHRMHAEHNRQTDGAGGLIRILH